MQLQASTPLKTKATLSTVGGGVPAARIDSVLLRPGWMVKMNRSTLVRRRTQAALSTQIPFLRLMIFAQYARNEPKVVPLLH
jgi:hypothetical protein